jgi:hypothetical protein
MVTNPFSWALFNMESEKGLSNRRGRQVMISRRISNLFFKSKICFNLRAIQAKNYWLNLLIPNILQYIHIPKKYNYETQKYTSLIG